MDYFMKNEKQIIDTKGYQNLLQEVKGLLDSGLKKAYKAVDNIKVQTYWQVGERIVKEELKYKDRANYGEYLIKNLTEDLKIKKRLLYRSVQFYNTYPIVSALQTQLSWYHYLELIRVDNEKERKFYEQKTIQNSWGYRELHKQIESKLYESTSPEEIEATFQKKLPTTTALEVFKNTYDFNFVELENKKEKEKELENKLVANIEKFLNELGNDFAFVGRQIPIKIDSQTHSIDLVLYHFGIPCKILVDLKSGKINSNHIGQMNKYVAYYKKNCQYEHEKDTIGLIIGKEAGKEEIEYALDKLEKQIFIATYKTKLPSDEKIKKAVKKLK
jgi:predicted nuclease of restriction endonuclease-like (RecB) superfamily